MTAFAPRIPDLNPQRHTNPPHHMNTTAGDLTIPECLMDHPSLDCTEKLMLAYIAEHPGCSDHQLSEVTHLGLATIQAHIHDLCRREHLHQSTIGGARKLTVVALELDRAQTDLTRPDLTFESAGDTLLALFELGQIRLGSTEFDGVILKRLGLSSLGCALLLESSMLRTIHHRRAEASGQVPTPPAGAVENLRPARPASEDAGSSSVGAESTDGASWTWYQADRHPAVAQLAAVLEAQAREQNTQALSPADAQILKVARSWLEQDEWDEALCVLDKIHHSARLQPSVLALATQVAGAAPEVDYARLLSMISIQLAPDRVEGWLAAATAARHAPSAGVNCELITLFKAAQRHPTEWRISYRLACCFCRMGDLAGTRDFLAIAEAQGGAHDIEVMLWEDPDLEAYRQDLLKHEPK